jgi:uncharacterized protein YjiS (DUF1127 family)
MLMIPHGPADAAKPLARRVAGVAAALAGTIRELYGAIKRRRDMAALAGLDDHTLSDIGLTRSGLGEVIEPPAWRPSTAAPGRAGAADELTPRIKRWQPGEDKNRRVLAELDDDELSNLSELGLQVRREARRQARER